MSESSAVPESPSRLGEGKEASDSVEDQHGGTISEPQETEEPTSGRPGPDDEQEENAETSLDQPSQ